ncbi:MAG TPA: hypothetical protein VHD36_00955 [Pirellulales bacterium]|nr:hypothetical protein [Pirellulales bacterium]
MRSSPPGTVTEAPPAPQAAPADAYGRRTLSTARIAPTLKAAPLEATDRAFPINLASALRLADARPLIVTAAQAAAWVAEARLQRAKLVAVPELDFGVLYYRHDGFGPDFNRGVNHPSFGFPGGGGPLNQNLNAMWIGGSFFATFPVTEAIFQPLAARQILNSRRYDIQTAKNDALLATANSYFAVHQYRGQYAGAVDVVARGRLLLERIQLLSKDLVPRVEVDRAANMLAMMELRAAYARQQWRVASANLTQLLRLDPRVIVAPLEPDHLQITLIEPDTPLDQLMPIGVGSRPEIASQRALIQAAQIGVRQEKNRPLLPIFLLTGFQTPGDMRMQGVVYGLGYGRNMNNWSLREDVSLQAIWQLDALGFGNLARIKKQRGMESQAIVDLFKLQDEIVAEITKSQARLQAAAVRVVEAERSLREAVITFDGNYEGLKQTKRFENILVQVYRPQEADASLENLSVSYDQYFATVADYNRAQFELFHALGYPAREIAFLRPPGEALPVDVVRPDYLPPVGIGPPPATR